MVLGGPCKVQVLYSSGCLTEIQGLYLAGSTKDHDWAYFLDLGHGITSHGCGLERSHVGCGWLQAWEPMGPGTLAYPSQFQAQLQLKYSCC